MAATLFSGVNVALQAVLAQQQAIEIIEHNVANANSAGYHRQQAVMGAVSSAAMPGLERDTSAGILGNGVIVKEIRRFSDQFIENRYRFETSDASKWDLESSVMQQVEGTMAENDIDGLLPKLDSFWAAWQSLSADPTNTSLRADLVDRTNDLTAGFNRRMQELMAIQQDQNTGITQRIQQVNDYAQQVAVLNGEISRVASVGQQPNDLIDSRDLLLDKLSQLTGASVAFQDNGEAMVSIGGHALVVGHTTFALTTQPNAVHPQLVDVAWADGQTFTSTTGEINGLLDVRNNTIPGLMANLDTLATALIGAVNTQHMAGYGLDGTSHNIAFLTGTGALDIAVNGVIQNNTDLIAAASQTNSPGDGNNALAIGRIQEQLLLTGAPATQTLNQYYNTAVTNFGLRTSNAAQTASDRKLVADALDQQRTSVSGVSLNEEAAKLATAQSTFNAASRLMSTLNDMMNTLINGMGI
jgi:flagellar hook-associated protein 1